MDVISCCPYKVADGINILETIEPIKHHSKVHHSSVQHSAAAAYTIVKYKASKYISAAQYSMYSTYKYKYKLVVGRGALVRFRKFLFLFLFRKFSRQNFVKLQASF